MCPYDFIRKFESMYATIASSDHALALLRFDVKGITEF